MADIKKHNPDSEGFDDNFDSEFDNLDSDFGDFGDFDKIDGGPDTKPEKRKPITDFTQSAVKGALLPSQQTLSTIKSSVDRALPNTGQTISEGLDAVTQVREMTSDLISGITPTINRVKRVSNRLLEKVDKDNSSWLVRKLKEMTQTAEEGPTKTLEDERNEFIAAKLENLGKIQIDALKQQEVSEEVRTLLKNQLDALKHEDQQTLLARIAQATEGAHSFFQTAFRSYISKSLELEYRSAFYLQDITALQKSSTAILDTKLEKIIYNTGLPELVKSHTSERFKRLAEEKLFGKIHTSMEEWGRTFISKSLSNLKTNVFGAAKNAINTLGEAAATAGEMKLDMDEMGEEFGDKESGAASAGGFLGRLLQSSLIKKGIKKLQDSNISEFRSFDEFVQDKKMSGLVDLNTKLRSTDNGALRWLADNVFPTLEKDRGVEATNLLDKALEPAIYDIATKQAIVDVIPGLLSKIHSQVEGIAKKMGAEATEELVYDFKSTDFKRASTMVEELKTKMFQTKEARSTAIKPIVQGIIRRYLDNGGDQNTVNENIKDLTTLVYNSSKNVINIKPKMFQKLLDGNLNSSEENVMDDLLRGVKNKEIIAEIITTAYIKDGKQDEGGIAKLQQGTREITMSIDTNLQRNLKDVYTQNLTRHFKDDNMFSGASDEQREAFRQKLTNKLLKKKKRKYLTESERRDVEAQVRERFNTTSVNQDEVRKHLTDLDNEAILEADEYINSSDKLREDRFDTFIERSEKKEEDDENEKKGFFGLFKRDTKKGAAAVKDAYKSAITNEETGEEATTVKDKAKTALTNVRKKATKTKDQFKQKHETDSLVAAGKKQLTDTTNKTKSTLKIGKDRTQEVFKKSKDVLTSGVSDKEGIKEKTILLTKNTQTLLKSTASSIMSSDTIKKQLDDINNELEGKGPSTYKGVAASKLLNAKKKLQAQYVTLKNKEVSVKLVNKYQSLSESLGNKTLNKVPLKDLKKKSPKEIVSFLRTSIQKESEEFKDKFLKDNNASSIDEALFNYFENNWKEVKQDASLDNPEHILGKMYKKTTDTAKRIEDSISSRAESFKESEEAGTIAEAAKSRVTSQVKKVSTRVKGTSAELEERARNKWKSLTIGGIKVEDFAKMDLNGQMDVLNEAMKTDKDAFLKKIANARDDILNHEVNGTPIKNLTGTQLPGYFRMQKQKAKIYDKILELAERRKEQGEDPLDTIKELDIGKTKNPRLRKKGTDKLHDEVNISGPGTYHQMADKELHVPLNKSEETMNFFKKLKEIFSPGGDNQNNQSPTNNDQLEYLKGINISLSVLNSSFADTSAKQLALLSAILKQSEINAAMSVEDPLQKKGLLSKIKSGKIGSFLKGTKGVISAPFKAIKWGGNLVGSLARMYGTLGGKSLSILGTGLGITGKALGVIIPGLVKGGVLLAGGVGKSLPYLAKGVGSFYGGLGTGLGYMGKGIGSGIGSLAKGVGMAIPKIPGAIGSIASGVGNMYKGMGTVASTGFKAVSGTFGLIGKAFKGAGKLVSMIFRGKKGQEELAAKSAINEQIIINHVGSKLDTIIQILEQGPRPKKKGFLATIFGKKGASEDTPREGSFKDFLQDKKEAHKEKRMDAIADNVARIAEHLTGKSSKATPDKNLVDMAVAGGGGLLGKFFGGSDGQQGQGGSGRDLLGTAADAAMLKAGLGGKGKGTSAPKLKGGRLKGLLKGGGKLIKGAGLAGALYSGASLFSSLKSGDYGSAALDAGGLALSVGAMGGLGSLGSMAGTAGTFLLSNPIGWAVLGAAATAAAGYGAFKFFKGRKQKKEATKAIYERILPLYGSDNNQLESIIDLEKTIHKLFKKKDREISKKELKKQAEKFGFDPDNNNEMKYFTAWLRNRFIPIFMSKSELLEEHFKVDYDEVYNLSTREDQDLLIQILQDQLSKLPEENQNLTSTLKGYQTQLEPEDKKKVDERIARQETSKDGSSKEEESWIQKVAKSSEAMAGAGIMGATTLYNWGKTKLFGPSPQTPSYGASAGKSVAIGAAAGTVALREVQNTIRKGKSRSRKTVEFVVKTWGPLLDEVLPIVYGMIGIHVPKELALALITQESNGNMNAVSPVGARGLVQIMPKTAEWLSSQVKIPTNMILTDPKSNLIAGLYYLATLHRKLKSWDQALLAYNWGIGNVYKFRKGERKDMPLEAQNYAPGVFANLDTVQQILGTQVNQDDFKLANLAVASAVVPTGAKAITQASNNVVPITQNQQLQQYTPSVNPTMVAGASTAATVAAVSTVSPENVNTSNVTQISTPRMTQVESNKVLESSLSVQTQQLNTLTDILNAVKDLSKQTLDGITESSDGTQKKGSQVDIELLIQKMDWIAEALMNIQPKNDKSTSSSQQPVIIPQRPYPEKPNSSGVSMRKTKTAI